MNRLSRRSLVGIFASAILAIPMFSLLPAAAETPNAPRFDDCTKVRLFVVRGSGESGNFGGLLQMVINSLGVVSGTSKFSVRGIPSYEYPGYLWPKHITFALTANYNDSKNKGYSSLFTELSEWGKSCPDSKVALLGYSQGAHIVGDMAETISGGGLPNVPSVNLIGATLFADPAFNPKSLGVYGGYDRSAISSWGLMGRRSLYLSNLDGKILSICAGGDSICQGSNFTMNAVALGVGIGVHVNYPALSYGSEPYVVHASNWLGDRIKQAIAYTAVPAPVVSTPATQTPATQTPATQTPATQTPATQTPTSPSAPLFPINQNEQTWTETTGSVAHTWVNYLNAGGAEGATIASNTSVQISCKVAGFKVADGNTWWYRIAQSPWNDKYFVSADAFYNNGQTSGGLHGTPFVDSSIKDCGSIVATPAPITVPIAPSTPVPTATTTWGETSGSTANTWTNYSNAGGTQGPTIGSNATVQIACKTSGFKVADGNTWWYRIAQSPWSNLYYVSADAFYNNGAVSGSLHATPFFDPSVPNCDATPIVAPTPTPVVVAPTPTPVVVAPTPTPVVVAPTPTPVVVAPVVPASVNLAQGPAAPHGYRYAITLSHFTPNASISVNCYDSVSPGGFFPFAMSTDGSGNASTAVQCYSADGPDHWVIAGGVQSNHIQWTIAPPAPVVVAPVAPAPTWGETTGSTANTWTNYSNAGGSQGPTIGSNQTVAISCKVGGFRVADGNTWWYRIAQGPWSNQYFVSADAFYNNGATSGSLHGTPFFDPAVPNC